MTEGFYHLTLSNLYHISYMPDIILDASEDFFSEIPGAMPEKRKYYFEIHNSKIPFREKIILE